MGLFSFLFKKDKTKDEQKKEPKKEKSFQWLDGKKDELETDEVTEIEEFLEDDF